MLHALTDGDAAPSVSFWRGCAIPNTSDNFGRTQRTNAVGSPHRAIRRAVPGAERIAMDQDIAAATRELDRHGRSHREHTRVEDETERARRLYPTRCGGR